VVVSTSGSSMNMKFLIRFRAASKLGFSWSNEKVIVKFYLSVTHVLVPLHISCSVYQFVGMPSKV
jgi:hypothetical protein